MHAVIIDPAIILPIIQCLPKYIATMKVLNVVLYYIKDVDKYNDLNCYTMIHTEKHHLRHEYIPMIEVLFLMS